MRHVGLDRQRARWFLGGMANTCKSWEVDQLVLLPPSVQELVPAGQLAHFVRNLVRESLDVSAILKPDTEDRGFPPDAPTMMTALLRYADGPGLYASRRIAKAGEERGDCMAVTARHSPDFRTISDVRTRQLTARGGLFTQGLQLCQQAGLVSLGPVALDGTKIRANAAKPTAMRDGRMTAAEPAWAAEVAQWLAKAAALDGREDAADGVDRRGDELPEWVAHTQQRGEKIRAANAAVEADAEATARKEAAPSDRPRRGRPATHPPGTPHDRAPRKFTDPDRRIMQARDGCIHGSTAQAAVDAEHQVIGAQGLTNQARDAHPLEPMRAHLRRHTGRQARELAAAAGDCSEHTLTALARRPVRGSVATGRHQHGEASAVGRRKTVPRTHVHAMTIRLKRAGYRSRYRLRTPVVEPVFGQIKQARGFRQCLLRGLAQVAGEWSVRCRAHNVLTLAGARGGLPHNGTTSHPSARSSATCHGGG